MSKTIRETQIPASDHAKIDRLKSKVYRDAYLESQVQGWISHQFRALRISMGLTQKEMAKKIGKPQSVISRLENDEYGKVSVQTLLDVAKAIDIALLVQFVSYPDFLERLRDKTSPSMVPENLSQSAVAVDQTKAMEAHFQSGRQNRQSIRPHFGSNAAPQGIFSSAVKNQSSNFNNPKSALMSYQKTNMQASERTLQ